MKTNAFQMGIGVGCLGILIALPIALWNVPFRGEHWSLLYAFVESVGSEKIHEITHFSCFGDARFQPFAFWPVIFAYIAFGLTFGGHYFVAIVLHILLGYLIVRSLSCLGGQCETHAWALFKRYPLEWGLILVLFAFIDVLTWTFFIYLQLACVLTWLAIVYYLENRHDGAWSTFVLIGLAILIYEAFVVAFVLFYLHFLVTKYAKLRSYWSKTMTCLPAIFVGIIIAKFSQTYQPETVTIPQNVSTLFGETLITRHDSLFRANGAHYKPIFILYNFTLLILNTLRGSTFPSVANKFNIYELQNMQWLLAQYLPLAAIVLGFLFLFAIHRLRNQISVDVLGLLLLFLLCGGGLFSIICLGRLESGTYPSTQFRYALICIPFFLLVVLHVARLVARNKILYPITLTLLITINSANSMAHISRLQNDLSSPAQLVLNLKAKGRSEQEIVAAQIRAMNRFAFKTPQDNAFLIYNGRGCTKQYAIRFASRP